MNNNEKPMKYNGYTIEEDQRNPYGSPEFMYYKTSEGIQHDGDYDGEGYKYCGNCKWASTLTDAMAEIEEICFMAGMFEYKFKTGTRGVFAIDEMWSAFGRNIDEAMKHIEEQIGSKDYRLISITK